MGNQLVAQFISVIVTVVWSGLISFIILKIVDATVGLRVDPDEETEGLDLTLHDERGYNLQG